MSKVTIIVEEIDETNTFSIENDDTGIAVLQATERVRQAYTGEIENVRLRAEKVAAIVGPFFEQLSKMFDPKVPDPREPADDEIIPVTQEDLDHAYDTMEEMEETGLPRIEVVELGESNPIGISVPVDEFVGAEAVTVKNVNLGHYDTEVLPVVE
jgi:hypothetical protein